MVESIGLLVAAMVLQSGALTGDMRAPDQARDARPLTEIASGCVTFPGVNVGKDDFDLGDCLPVESGTVGHLDHRWYHYVFYCLLSNRSQRKCGKSDVPRGVAIFVSDDDSAFVRLLLARAGSNFWPEAVVQRPQLIASPVGTFLQVNVESSGFNESVYYLWRPSQRAWQRIDFSEYHLRAQLQDKLPRGWVWNACAMDPDLSSMRTLTYMTRPNGSRCSGTTVNIRMMVRNGMFNVDSAEITGQGRIRPTPSRPSTMQADMKRLTSRAEALPSIWPWQELPNTEIDRVARYGKRVVPLLLELLPDDPEGLSPPAPEYRVQQHAALVLCRIYGIQERCGNIYCNRASDYTNRGVRAFWLWKIAESEK